LASKTLFTIQKKIEAAAGRVAKARSTREYANAIRYFDRLEAKHYRLTEQYHFLNDSRALYSNSLSNASRKHHAEPVPGSSPRTSYSDPPFQPAKAPTRSSSAGRRILPVIAAAGIACLASGCACYKGFVKAVKYEPQTPEEKRLVEELEKHQNNDYRWDWRTPR
jgi:hypothetical protein